MNLRKKFINVTYHPIRDYRYLSELGSRRVHGDLHSNALAFFNYLCSDGTIILSKRKYDKLAKILVKNANELTKKDLQLFNKILAEAKMDAKGLVELIGDETHDRGPNDYFILKIIEKLSQAKVPLKILASNHGVGFVRAYEELNTFAPTEVAPAQSRSIVGLQTLIERKLISREEVMDIIENHYKPHLVVTDISISENETTDLEAPQFKSTYYLHAPFGSNTIEDLAKQLEVPCKLDTIADEIQTFKLINEKYAEYVKTNLVHTLLPTAKQLQKNQLTAFHQAIWNREQNGLRFDPHKTYVHGHDGCGKAANKQMINLDNAIAKISILDNEGICPTYYSHDTSCESKSELAKAIEKFKEDFNKNMQSLLHADSLIFKRNITSLTQLQLLKNLFCKTDSLAEWQELLSTEENKAQFLKAMAINPIVLDILAILKAYHLLTRNNFQAIIQNIDHAENIFNILLILNHKNHQKLPRTINQKNLDLIIENAYNSSQIHAVFIECLQNNTLTDTNIPQIIESAKDCDYCDKLKFYNLMTFLKPETAQFPKSILNNSTAANLYRALIACNEMDLLNGYKLNEFIMHLFKYLDFKKYLADFGNLILLLKKRNLLSESSLALIQSSPKDFRHLENIINLLDNLRFLNNQYILLIIKLFGNDLSTLDAVLTTLSTTKKWNYYRFERNTQWLENIARIINYLKTRQVYRLNLLEEILNANHLEIYDALNYYEQHCEISAPEVWVITELSRLELLKIDDIFNEHNEDYLISFFQVLYELYNSQLLNKTSFDYLLTNIEFSAEINDYIDLLHRAYGELAPHNWQLICDSVNEFEVIEDIITYFQLDEENCDYAYTQAYFDLLVAYPQKIALIHGALLAFSKDVNAASLFTQLLNHMNEIILILEKMEPEKINLHDKVRQAILPILNKTTPKRSSLNNLTFYGTQNILPLKEKDSNIPSPNNPEGFTKNRSSSL